MCDKSATLRCWVVIIHWAITIPTDKIYLFLLFPSLLCTLSPSLSLMEYKNQCIPPEKPLCCNLCNTKSQNFKKLLIMNRFAQDSSI